jgi:hypothetical protein
MKAKRE